MPPQSRVLWLCPPLSPPGSIPLPAKGIMLLGHCAVADGRSKVVAHVTRRGRTALVHLLLPRLGFADVRCYMVKTEPLPGSVATVTSPAITTPHRHRD